MEPEGVRAALARGLSYDPAPAVVLREGPARDAVDALLGAMPQARATHVGVGAVERGGRAWIVLLAADRRARLDPFPRDVAPGAEAVLSGTLASGLRDARVFVTPPSGDAHELDTDGGGRAFRARIRFDAAGRYAVEVIADGARGPEVAALALVSSGGADLAAPPERPGPAARPAGTDAGAAEARVLAALNATRARRGLPPLARDARLAAVARRHSADMAARGLVAHVLPGSGDAAARVARARIAYHLVLENVASAATALEAHAAIEESPAHLANVLSRDARSAGVGVARAPGGGAVYLTELLVAPPDDGDGGPLTTEERVRVALWRERARAHRPPLTADPRLDALAGEAARGMRDRGEPDPGDLRDRALALGRRTVAAVDVFVASAPSDAVRSRNVADPQFARVGVGVATGDSARFGAGRLFIAVVYTN